MHGCVRIGMIWLLLAPAGCQSDLAPPTAEVNPELGNAFDVNNTGTIRGHVSWQGDLPKVPSFQVHGYLDYVNGQRLRGEHLNPNAPRIDFKSRRVAQAVVALHQVKPALAKPWRHPPVEVQIQNERLVVMQGEAAGSVGLVRHNDEIQCVNRDVDYHTLRARGADFFTLPFVAPDPPTRRRLDKLGMVELSCGVGFFWKRAFLFVLDHPYAVVTDAKGEFMLDQVPVGTYRLTAWLPNWHVASRDRDPESGAIRRITFAPPVELEQSVTVTKGHSAEPSFVFTPNRFDAKD